MNITFNFIPDQPLQFGKLEVFRAQVLVLGLEGGPSGTITKLFWPNIFGLIFLEAAKSSKDEMGFKTA